MSGGAFDYKQSIIRDIANEIGQEIIQAGQKIPTEAWKNDWHGYSFEEKDQYYSTYNRKTIGIMKRAVYVLRMAHICAQRIDWMLSGDDSEESLEERLEEELKALKTKYPSGKFTFKKQNVRWDKDCECNREITDK
jgi:hypothetical protein